MNQTCYNLYVRHSRRPASRQTSRPTSPRHMLGYLQAKLAYAIFSASSIWVTHIIYSVNPEQTSKLGLVQERIHGHLCSRSSKGGGVSKMEPSIKCMLTTFTSCYRLFSVLMTIRLMSTTAPVWTLVQVPECFLSLVCLMAEDIVASIEGMQH